MAQQTDNSIFFEEEKKTDDSIFFKNGETDNSVFFEEDFEEDVTTPISDDPRNQRFFPVLSRTIDELQASGWAGVRVLGETFNSERLVDAGNRGIAVNEAQIAKRGRPLIAEEVEDLGDAMTFVKQGIAQIIPSVAVSMPTAIYGAKAGALASAAVPVPGARGVGAAVGGALGAFLPSFFLSTGEIDREMKARAGDDFESPGTAMAGGAIVASFDVASIAFGLKPLLPVLLKKATLKEVADKLVSEGVERGVAQAAVAQAVKASVIEGATEATQEGIEDFMAEFATGLASEEGQLQSSLLNAFLLGAIGGGTLGSVSGAITQSGVNQQKKADREVKQQLEAIEEEVLAEVNIAGETWATMTRAQLIEEAERRNLKIRKNANKATITKALTDFEVFNRRAQMTENYFLENFGALSAQEKIDRGVRKEELQGLEGEQLLELALEKTIESPFGGPDIAGIIVNRKEPKNQVIQKILDYELLEQRALTGGASIGYASAQTPQYQARLQELQKLDRKTLLKELKARKLKSSIEINGKRKTASNNEIAKMIMDRDAFMLMQKERMINYLSGKGYKNKKARRIIEKEGAVEGLNVITVKKKKWESENKDSTQTWEQYVEEVTGRDGEALGVRFQRDGVNILESTDNVLDIGQTGNLFEARDVAIEGEADIVEGSGLFNKFEENKQQGGTTEVDAVLVEGSPDRMAPNTFGQQVLRSLKVWFQPSGPLGWEAFMLSRQRTGRIRAMNKMAEQMGERVNMALASAVSEGVYTDVDVAAQAMTNALRRTIKRYKRDDDEIAELQSEKEELENTIKETESRISILDMFRSGELAYEDLTQAQKEFVNRFNTGGQLKNLRLQKLILQGDLLEIEQLLDPDYKALEPTQAAQLLPETLRDSFIELRSFIDMMSKRILREVPQEILAGKKGGKSLEQVIQENIGSYMTRSYRIFEAQGGYNPLSWWNRVMPTKSAMAMRQKVQDVRELLSRDGTRTEAEIENEIKLIGQGFVGEAPATEIGGIFGRSERQDGQEEAAIVDTTRELLKRRKRIAPQVRALMGEITNPGEAAAVTTARLASVLENNRFWQRLAVLNAMPGERLFSPVQVPRGQMEGVAPNWLGKAGGMTYKVKSNGFNPFEGMYTTKEIAETLALADDYSGNWNNSSIWRNFVVAPKAYVQLGKIVLSPPAQIRNFLSAALFVLGNGHFLGAKNLAQAMDVVGSELFQGRMDAQGRPTTSKQKAQETYRDLLDLGVINTSVRLGDLLSSWRMASTGIFEGPGDFTAATANPFRQMYRGAEAAYTAADDFWKIVAYASELQAIKKAFPTEADFNQMLAHASDLGISRTINRQSFQQAQKELAAYHVRQTIPNYDYVGKFADVLRTGPLAVFGNFIAFPTEIVRTSANILTTGLKEMKSDNSQIRKRGMARLSGYGLAAFGVGSAAQAIGQAISDVDEEDIEAARKFLPDWAQNNLIIPIVRKSEEEGGGFDFIDGSYIMVYDDLARAVPTILNEATKKANEGRSEADIVVSSLTKAMGDFLEPFIEPSIYAQAMLDLAQNRNSNTGNAIWNETEARGKPLDGVGSRAEAYVGYLVDRIAPGFITAGGKVIRGAQEGEKTYDRFGTKQEFEDAMASFFGIKVSRVNPTSSLGFAVTDLKKEVSSAEKIFTSKVYSKGPVTPQELLEAYTLSQQANYFINQDFYSLFSAAERLGAKQSVVDTTLKERLSKKQARMIKNGENLPLKDRKSLNSLRKVFDKNTEAIESAEELPSNRFFPMDDFMFVYNYFKNLPLESDYQAELVREEEFEYFE